MTEEICFTKKVNLLEEIINHAVALPIEGQDQILRVAKAMQYTRKCMGGECVERGSASISAGGTQIYAGSYGGGYRLADSGRTVLIGAGIIVIVLGIIFFCNLLAAGKSYVKIYENRIQGLSSVGMLFFTVKKEYEIEYHQIEDIQVVKNPLFGDSIVIKASGNRYGLLIAENVNQAADIIKQRIR